MLSYGTIAIVINRLSTGVYRKIERDSSMHSVCAYRGST